MYNKVIVNINVIAELKIRRGNRGNLGITFPIFSLAVVIALLLWVLSALAASFKNFDIF